VIRIQFIVGPSGTAPPAYEVAENQRVSRTDGWVEITEFVVDKPQQTGFDDDYTYDRAIVSWPNHRIKQIDWQVTQ
jgi:hypothetical protein